MALCLVLAFVQVRQALLAGGDMALLSPDTATRLLPWSAVLEASGELDHEVSRPRQPGLSDQGINLYPTYTWVLSSYLAGDTPTWNPLIYTGAPNFGNPQSGALDPQVLAMLPLVDAWGARGFHMGLALAAFLRLAIALLGAYALGRLLGLTPAGGLLAAVGFGCSGYLLAWRDAPLGHVTPFLPWVLYGVERCGRVRPALGALIAAAAMALAIHGGHPETAFFAGAGAGLLALALFMRDRRAGLFALGGLALGTLLSAVPLLAFLDYLPESNAAAVRAVAQRSMSVDGLGLGLGALGVVGLALLARRDAGSSARRDAGVSTRTAHVARALASGALAVLLLWLVFGLGHASATLQLALVPDLFGKPGVGAGYAGAGSWPEASGAWLVLPVLALALAATLTPGLQLRRGRTLAVVGWLSFAAAIEFPGLVDLQRMVPFIGLGDPGRLAVLSSLCLSLLAGAGLARAAPLARSVAACVCAAAVLFLVARAALPSTFSDAALEAEARSGVERLEQRGAGYLVRPGVSVRTQNVDLEGWYAPGDAAAFESAVLEVRSAADRGRSGDADEGAPLFVLPIETSAAPALGLRELAAQRAPEGARFFRFNYLQMNRLDAGVWRLDLRLADGSQRLLVRATEIHRPFGGAWAAVGALLLMAAGVAGLGPGRAWLRGGLVLAAALQGLWMAEGSHPAVPAAEAFPETVTEQLLAKHLGEHRFFSEPGVLPPDTGLVRGLRALDGYDALDPVGYSRYRSFALRPGVPPLLGWNARGVDFTSPAFQLLGVNCLALAGPIEAPGFELIAAPDGSAERYAETFFYVDATPLPRAFVAAEVIAPEELQQRLDAGLWDPLQTAAVREAWTPGAPLESASVRSLERRNALQRFEVELQGSGLLVVTDQFFPGWSATVDGEPVEILKANANFRGVPLTDGRHVVEFRYRPTRQGLALVLVALGALGLLALAFSATRGGGQAASDPNRSRD